MRVRVLVVDDEPDVEALFRQQFRHEVREGLYLLDFALSGEAALNKLESCVGEEVIRAESQQLGHQHSRKVRKWLGGLWPLPGGDQVSQ